MRAILLLYGLLALCGATFTKCLIGGLETGPHIPSLSSATMNTYMIYSVDLNETDGTVHHVLSHTFTDLNNVSRGGGLIFPNASSFIALIGSDPFSSTRLFQDWRGEVVSLDGKQQVTGVLDFGSAPGATLFGGWGGQDSLTYQSNGVLQWFMHDYWWTNTTFWEYDGKSTRMVYQAETEWFYASIANSSTLSFVQWRIVHYTTLNGYLVTLDENYNVKYNVSIGTQQYGWNVIVLDGATGAATAWQNTYTYGESSSTITQLTTTMTTSIYESPAIFETMGSVAYPGGFVESRYAINDGLSWYVMSFNMSQSFVIMRLANDGSSSDIYGPFTLDSDSSSSMPPDEYFTTLYCY